MYVYCIESFAHIVISSVTVMVRTGGAIRLNPFATVLFNVCSAVTVWCCVLYPCCVGVLGMFAVKILMLHVVIYNYCHLKSELHFR